MKGLGVEIAKNIILAGVKTVAIYDNEAAIYKDMSSNFYITEEDIGKPRAEVCLQKLKELNPYVTVSRREEPWTEEYVQSFRVVVATNLLSSEQEELDAICHKHNVCFIGANTYGLAARIFCDFGESFTVTDIDDSEPGQVLVGDISRDKEGLVTIAEDRHPFQEGDFVTFSDVHGMTELNGCSPRRIHVLGPQQFTIGDTSAFSSYESFGWCKQVKRPATFHFLPLKEANHTPGEFQVTDFGKLENAASLHVAVQTLDRFISEMKRPPCPFDETDADRFVAMAEAFRGDLEVSPAVLRNFAQTCCGELGPVAAAMGGAAAQEVLKACGGKFAPIRQFLYYDAFEALPPRESHEDCREEGSRYDGITVVFGREFQQRLSESRVFLVGAGAIGCEMLKNLALLGVGTSPRGKIIVTDMDRIERSNLSRQFLFRGNDVGQSKARTAARAVQKMNPAVHVECWEVKVGPETEDTFSDEFMESLTAVCNALDNVEARKYMDSRCVRFGKPLLESGTLGTRGNTQIVIPHVTESYSSQSDPQEKSIPMCTLKNFPYKIEHTIQWSHAIQTLAGYRDDAGYLDSFGDKTDLHDDAVRALHELLVEWPCNSFDDCIRWAAGLFRRLYYEEIEQLIHQFPRDFVDENGNKFWTGNKLFPTAVAFDARNPHHVEFVRYASLLHAECLGIPAEDDVDHIVKVANAMKFPPFVPRNTNVTNTNEIIANLVKELPPRESLKNVKTHPAEFEKDDDSNHHIDFIAACANLRAENYGIATADRATVKKIAGKIIPAISTTTAFVTGVIAVELLKITAGLKDIERYRSCFANLSMPMICFSEPGPCAVFHSCGRRWTEWDHVVVPKQRAHTLGDFMEYLRRELGVEVSMVNYGEKMLFMGFGAPAVLEKKKQTPLMQLLRDIAHFEPKKGQKYVELIVTVESDDDDEYFPTVFLEL
ncbi:hypothetical protein WA538_002210 [Blastocystis sp. DL]